MKNIISVMRVKNSNLGMEKMKIINFFLDIWKFHRIQLTVNVNGWSLPSLFDARGQRRCSNAVNDALKLNK